MSSVEGRFAERGSEPQTRAVPLSHVSVELGHLYPEDWSGGRTRVRSILADTVPWAAAALQAVSAPGRRLRASTCFLVDDYFGHLPGPDIIVPEILSIAAELGIVIDYLGREAGCAQAMGPAGLVSPAHLLADQIVEEPPPGALGQRPSVAESGWLCNGIRSPSGEPGQAMHVDSPRAPPRQSAARLHSIFVDVQLWDGADDNRRWSCPLLAATWQVLRLGLLRSAGMPPVAPEPAPPLWPGEWSALPPVVQLSERVHPFSAYTTASVLSPRFLPVELAVRTILGQVQHDPEILHQIRTRATAERFALPLEVVDRIHYALVGFSETDPA